MNTFEIVRLIGDVPKELLNFTETSLLTRMAIFGNKEGKNIDPGIKELMRQTKISRRSLMRALGSLVKKGFLVLCCGRQMGIWDKTCYDINVFLLQKVRVDNNEGNKSYITKLNLSKKPNNLEQNLSTSGARVAPLTGATVRCLSGSTI